MSPLPRPQSPPDDFGMLSLVVGAIGLIFFFLPILGIPLGAMGLLFGIVAIPRAYRWGGVRLRWGLLGCAMAALALAVSLAIAYAPGGYVPGPITRPPPWQPVPGRPVVAPPASGRQPM